MSSALQRGRPIRFRPSTPGSAKPPECAGIYYIRDAEGNVIYTGQAVNLRRRVYQHKRNGKIPKDGYVECFKAKDGITYNELDATERKKINKYNPPLNRRAGGGGRKSPLLGKPSSPEHPAGNTIPTGSGINRKISSLYRLLGYEKIDRAGTVHYKKEPKAVFFMVVELIIKILLIATTLLAVFSIYMKFAQNVLFNQYLLIGIATLPIIFLILFPYIRRSKLSKALVIISVLASLIVYLSSYPLPVKWPF